MSNFQLRLIIYIALAAALNLAFVILFAPTNTGIRAGAALCLWGCGLLAGMSWQVLICRKHDVHGDSHAS